MITYPVVEKFVSINGESRENRSIYPNERLQSCLQLL